VPPERFVRTADDAAAAAQQVGCPVVLKAVSAALPHKSDAGLVMLGLHDADAVRDAATALLTRAGALPLQLDGVLVAKHISGGIETVLGIHHDVEMGPVVMFGMGGVMVELFKDASFAPAFLDREGAREMVRATRAGRLIEGFRGRAGDLDALCAALVNLGRLARDLGDMIEAVDVNPFAVCDKGAFALDALVVLRPPRK
jgi:acetate---CoA ligase (ADP-forming)